MTRTKILTLLNACLIALGALSHADESHAADALRLPPMPAKIQVTDGSRPFLMLHAVGSQNQVCLPRTAPATGLGWTLYGPQATLFDGDVEQVMTHFLSGNPDEGGLARPTWRDSRDSSAVWAKMVESSDDQSFVKPGAIPWVLLRVSGAKNGPTGGHKLSATTYVQRVNTEGGTPPPGDCAPLGAKMMVPYSADYVFYKAK